ncbi:MAG: class I SAM-dependent methyltransferase [Planctomycetota bacterium]
MTDPVSSWDTVAPAYARYWSPRFAPHLQDTLAGFDPPPGDLVVVGAGPGDEAVLLAQRFPERTVWALEPAPAMLDLLLARDLPSNLTVQSARAREVSEHVRQAGGFVSAFVLQLLPDRALALADWRRAATPGAVARVVFWPRQSEGAWCRLGEAVEAATGTARPGWEAPLREQLPKLGWELARSDDLVHPIVHADVDEAWWSLVDACSLQALLQRAGPAALARCEARWKADPGLEACAEGVVHSPTARLWTLRAR